MSQQHNQPDARLSRLRDAGPVTPGNKPPAPPLVPEARPSGLRVVAFAVAGLLIVIIGALALAINENARVKLLTEQALNFDVEVEDEGDDVRIAVLELRHAHRNIALGGASAAAERDFDIAFDALTEELGELRALDLDQHGLEQPELIGRLAAEYHALFRPAIRLALADRAAFDAISDQGLGLLSEMDDAAEALDTFGEQLADESLDRVNNSLRTEQAILWGLMVGAAGVAVVLAVAASRILHQLSTLYARDQETQAALTAALRTKTDFIADASHELRTPLAIIIGNAETSLTSPTAVNHAGALRAIADEAHRMNRLVDDLLFLARTDAGALPLDIEYVPARWLAQRTAALANQLATQRGACLDADTSGQGLLEADPERIQQAVLILVDNAARHSPPDHCIRLTTRIADGAYVVNVRDAGPGIGPSELPHIFERFYQVKHGRTRSQAGSGLGLSIAQSIVLAHRGTLDAQSTPSQGTLMTISLPLAPTDDSAFEPEEVSSTAAAASNAP